MVLSKLNIQKLVSQHTRGRYTFQPLWVSGERRSECDGRCFSLRLRFIQKENNTFFQKAHRYKVLNMQTIDENNPKTKYEPRFPEEDTLILEITRIACSRNVLCFSSKIVKFSVKKRDHLEALENKNPYIYSPVHRDDVFRYFRNRSIHYLHKSHNTLLFPQTNLHRHCLRLLLGHLHVPAEIANNDCANFWG